jgi:hypothetical protein
MNNKYYICECRCGVLCFQYEQGLGLEIAMFSQHPSRSLWNRVRLAWNALSGQPYTDMVILNDQQIADLVDQLTEIQNCDEYNRDAPLYSIIHKLHEYDSKQAIDVILEYLKQTKYSAHTQRLISEITPLKY